MNVQPNVKEFTFRRTFSVVLMKASRVTDKEPAPAMKSV